MVIALIRSIKVRNVRTKLFKKYFLAKMQICIFSGSAEQDCLLERGMQFSAVYIVANL
jgi:hypothetical protein